ncbi:uncharacterized protein LOC123446405 isoform X3 [Hordeum vulgare subsp. vulgare]|uniref:uncharacterized protein LOC123446405 isoform X3 n=1 Tax=Hordeum vulgare subsp. vulgare TaxID=112509 RepID=UPI001D1A5B42|nr:uncharacterized protein LOC123446405 isoform X3 [Hordeum vulgare subsp. vulgare]
MSLDLLARELPPESCLLLLSPAWSRPSGSPAATMGHGACMPATPTFRWPASRRQAAAPGANPCYRYAPDETDVPHCRPPFALPNACFARRHCPVPCIARPG